MSAIAEFLVLYYDVEVHSLVYATASVSIGPMAVCFNGETLLSPSVHTDDKILFSFFHFLHLTITQQISGALSLYMASMFNF